MLSYTIDLIAPGSFLSCKRRHFLGTIHLILQDKTIFFLKRYLFFSLTVKRSSGISPNMWWICYGWQKKKREREKKKEISPGTWIISKNKSCMVHCMIRVTRISPQQCDMWLKSGILSYYWWSYARPCSLHSFYSCKEKEVTYMWECQT